MRLPRYTFSYDNRPQSQKNQRLKVLSFNIQVGINTHKYRHYLTKSWQHVLPFKSRYSNLENIASIIKEYDLIGLQEVDGGSVRSSYINQVKCLAEMANFPFWYQQLNRNLGKVAQHSNGFLSRIKPYLLEDFALPGIKGRGIILAKFKYGNDDIVVVNAHLALGAKHRQRQLSYITELVSGFRYKIIMGDMNTHSSNLLEGSAFKNLDLVAPHNGNTYPSWNPKKSLDHILVSSNLEVTDVKILPFIISDHLPVGLSIKLLQ